MEVFPLLAGLASLVDPGMFTGGAIAILPLLAGLAGGALGAGGAALGGLGALAGGAAGLAGILGKGALVGGGNLLHGAAQGAGALGVGALDTAGSLAKVGGQGLLQGLKPSFGLQFGGPNFGASIGIGGQQNENAELMAALMQILKSPRAAGGNALTVGGNTGVAPGPPAQMSPVGSGNPFLDATPQFSQFFQ